MLAIGPICGSLEPVFSDWRLRVGVLRQASRPTSMQHPMPMRRWRQILRFLAAVQLLPALESGEETLVGGQEHKGRKKQDQ